jgi:FKBP-type peptidyl-prolyl cis-trans isomerase SlyD
MSNSTSDGSAPTHRRIRSGDVVGYRYTMRTAAGQVLAVSAEVVHYLHGGHGTQPAALSSEMEGRRDGERFTTVLSRDAREAFPDLFRLATGTRLEAKTPEGEPLSLCVVDTTASELLLDFDHPLSDSGLHFEVSIVSIRIATADERRSGRPGRAADRDAGDTPKAVSLEATERSGTTEAEQPGVHAQLLDLRALLELQFSEEERKDGLFEDVIANAPESQRQVGVFRTTHQALLTQLDAIVARIERDDGPYDHRPALALLVEQLQRHEKAESAVLQDSLHTDVGGEG